MGHGGVQHYENLVDIIELNYEGILTVILFECEWVNTAHPKAINTDKVGFTSIDFTRPIHTEGHKDDEDLFN